MEDIYKRAALKKLRFDSPVGELTVEQLFDLPLTTQVRNKASLDNVSQIVQAELRDTNNLSMVEVTPNPKTAVLNLQVAILKDVIDTRKKDIDRRARSQEREQMRTQIQNALAKKQDEALNDASVEELMAKLKKLDEGEEVEELA